MSKLTEGTASNSQILLTKTTNLNEIPRCHVIFEDRDGKLYCAYDYENKRQKLLQTLPPDLMNDVGYVDYEEAFECGEISSECSAKECPMFLHRFLQRRAIKS